MILNYKGFFQCINNKILREVKIIKGDKMIKLTDLFISYKMLIDISKEKIFNNLLDTTTKNRR